MLSKDANILTLMSTIVLLLQILIEAILGRILVRSLLVKEYIPQHFITIPALCITHLANHKQKQLQCKQKQ